MKSAEKSKEIIDIILPLVYNSCIDAKRKGGVPASPFRLFLEDRCKSQFGCDYIRK